MDAGPMGTDRHGKLTDQACWQTGERLLCNENLWGELGENSLAGQQAVSAEGMAEDC
jgi:hypothetical protein